MEDGQTKKNINKHIIIQPLIARNIDSIRDLIPFIYS